MGGGGSGQFSRSDFKSNPIGWYPANRFLRLTIIVQIRRSSKNQAPMASWPNPSCRNLRVTRVAREHLTYNTFDMLARWRTRFPVLQACTGGRPPRSGHRGAIPTQSGLYVNPSVVATALHNSRSPEQSPVLVWWPLEHQRPFAHIPEVKYQNWKSIVVYHYNNIKICYTCDIIVYLIIVGVSSEGLGGITPTMWILAAPELYFIICIICYLFRLGEL